MPQHLSLYVICFALFSLVVMVVFDAAFPIANDLLLIRLGLKSNQGWDFSQMMRFREYGWRVFVIGGLYLLIMAGCAMEFYMAYISGKGISLLRCMVLITIAAALLGLATQWRSLAWTALRLRLAFRSKAIAAASAEALANWPNIHYLANAIGVEVTSYNAAYPNIISVESKALCARMMDEFGPLVRNTGNGISLDLKGYFLVKMWYCEGDFTPTTLNVGDPVGVYEITPIATEKIASKLYMVTYVHND